MLTRNRIFVLTIAAGFSVAGCRANQRTDLATNGYRDALECVVNKRIDAAAAAKQCDLRDFAPGSPEYKRGWFEATACARQNGGSGDSAAAVCKAKGPSA